MQNVLSHFHTLSHAYWKRQEIQFLRWETTLCCRVSVNYTRLRLCLCCSWVSCEYRRLEQYFFHFDWLTEAAWPLYQKRRNAAFARIALRILHCAQKSRNQANLHECSPKIFSISGRGKQLQCFFFEESREYASFVSRFVTPEVLPKKKSYKCTLNSIVYIQCTLASRYSIDDQ